MPDLMIAAMPYAFWGIVYHLIADWLFQNESMATKKTNLRNSEAWWHGLVHFVMMVAIFPLPFAILIALLHVLIDERSFMNWWRKKYGQTTEGEMGVHVAIWTDQVAHIVIICIISQLLAFMIQHGWA